MPSGCGPGDWVQRTPTGFLMVAIEGVLQRTQQHQPQVPCSLAEPETHPSHCYICCTGCHCCAGVTTATSCPLHCRPPTIGEVPHVPVDIPSSCVVLVQRHGHRRRSCSRLQGCGGAGIRPQPQQAVLLLDGVCDQAGAAAGAGGSLGFGRLALGWGDDGGVGGVGEVRRRDQINHVAPSLSMG